MVRILRYSTKAWNQFLAKQKYIWLSKTMGSNENSLNPMPLFVELNRWNFNQNQKKRHRKIRATTNSYTRLECHIVVPSRSVCVQYSPHPVSISSSKKKPKQILETRTTRDRSQNNPILRTEYWSIFIRYLFSFCVKTHTHTYKQKPQHSTLKGKTLKHSHQYRRREKYLPPDCYSESSYGQLRSNKKIKHNK